MMFKFLDKFIASLYPDYREENTIRKIRVNPVIGYKLCYTESIQTDSKPYYYALVKLEIPVGAYVRWGNYYGGHKKNRASAAKVLEITEYKTKKPLEKAFSMNDSLFVYEVGKTVKPNSKFCFNKYNECSSGIHFFLREEEINRWFPIF